MIYSDMSYRTGYCYIFAIAAQELTGHPLYNIRGYFKENGETFFEVCHVMIKISKGKYFDIDGISKRENLIKRCKFSNKNIIRVKIEPVSRNEIEYIFNVENPEDIADAEKMILRRFPDLFHPILYST